jgi:hypothetical protein
MAHVLFMQITKVADTHSEYVILNSFSTAIMVTWMCLNVMHTLPILLPISFYVVITSLFQMEWLYWELVKIEYEMTLFNWTLLSILFTVCMLYTDPFWLVSSTLWAGYLWLFNSRKCALLEETLSSSCRMLGHVPCCGFLSSLCWLPKTYS